MVSKAEEVGFVTDVFCYLTLDAHFLGPQLPTRGPLAAGLGKMCCETESVYKIIPPTISVREERKHARNIFHIVLQGWGNEELLGNRVMSMGEWVFPSILNVPKVSIHDKTAWRQKGKLGFQS